MVSRGTPYQRLLLALAAPMMSGPALPKASPTPLLVLPPSSILLQPPRAPTGSGDRPHRRPLKERKERNRRKRQRRASRG